MRIRHAAILVLPIFGLLLGPGCKSGKGRAGHWVSCTCPYLTDFDGVAKHSMDVCVPEGTEAEKAAFQCATKLAHGPAEACTCDQPQGPCDGLEACRSKEYK